MDFANERYVRLYTRDTISWLMLPWQGRALLPLLLRKVDRAGVLDLSPEHSPQECLSVLVALPLDVVTAGLDALSSAGVVDLSPSALVVPNFMEAQEAAISDAQRQRDSRERRRDKAKRHVGSRCSSREVTPNQPSLAKPNQPVAPPTPPDRADGRIPVTRPVLTASGWIAEFEYDEVFATAKRQAGSTCFAAQQAAEGVQRALYVYGRDLVERVTRYAAQQAAEYRTTQGERGVKPVLFARMFVGDGFGAWLDRYNEHRDTTEQLEGAEDPAEYIERIRAQRAAEDAQGDASAPWT